MAVKGRAAIKRRLDAAVLACAQRGSRLTVLRRAVLELILMAEGPVTAYQLLDQLKKKHKGAAPPTIYRALDFLLDNELIHKVESLSAFIPCIDAGNHSLSVQFLICRRCGTVAELEESTVSEALDRAAARQGFRPGSTIVEVQGLCAACSTQAS
jgi:Fur family zinc uptake transcriptional regulator